MNPYQYFLFIIIYTLVSADIQGQAGPAISDVQDTMLGNMKFRNIGPFRGGRSVAAAGVPGNDQIYYMGTCGGGIWKTEDAGLTWKNISDGYFHTGSVGAIAVAKSDPQTIYVGMGEHAVRGVMTSHGDGMYKSYDGGQTWEHLGLDQSRHISEIRVHPLNPELVYVAVQGAVHGSSETRGVFKSANGGETWEKILFVDDNTGAADLSMDPANPRILFAGMWDHRRFPWQVRSGGPGSGIYKSIDGGKSWEKLENGLPEKMGKVSIDVSQANSEIVYANIESENEKGGVYRSNDGGKSWNQTSKDRITVARAWYYIEIFSDPIDPETVYVLNAPMLKSIDGGKTFKTISNPHGDQHHMWINPSNNQNIILANDGGACITFNGGETWSSQQNQPTAQFYRVITDNRFPYYVYGGQQDNSTVCIASRTNDSGIDWKDWYPAAGCESAFLAFDPDDPNLVYGGCYQGNISVYNHDLKESKDIMAYPVAGLAWTPVEMRYRYNWNAPIIASPQNPNIIYHAGNKVLKTVDQGLTWEEISPDLTRNDPSKQHLGGVPFTNEGAGGEVYNTISYLEASIHDQNVLWAGSDCGLVHVTRDGGQNWQNVTPQQIGGEAIINSIDVSPHEPSTAYIAVMKYKFNDFSPFIYKTENFGESWTQIISGIDEEHFVRVVREDPVRPGLLYAGTESGLYISFDSGNQWQPFQQNLPICPITDLDFRHNDLVVSTMGRAFWILDDLNPLQQWPEKPSEELLLFASPPAYRFFGGSSPSLTRGQNPSNGLTIDYFIPPSTDSLELRLDIFDQRGTLIRQYSSEKDESFKKYIGGPSPEKILSSNKGHNRFYWDLRRESVPGIENVFVLGSYDGALVPPGIYTIQLTNGEIILEQTVEVKGDPRLDVSDYAYEEQYNILVALEEAVKEIHESVTSLRNINKQISTLSEILENNQDAADLLELGNQIGEKINKWEEELIQTKQKTFQDVINFPNKLNAEILNLMSRLSSHDPRVTAGARERKSELLNHWNQLKIQRDEIISEDVEAFNNLYSKLGIPAIVIPGNKKARP